MYNLGKRPTYPKSPRNMKNGENAKRKYETMRSHDRDLLSFQINAVLEPNTVSPRNLLIRQSFLGLLHIHLKLARDFDNMVEMLI